MISRILCKKRICLSNRSRRISSTVKTTDEVAAAIAEGRPVVALESTIISHGMPYPRNLEMAKEVEATIRQYGAIPATVAIIDGVPKAGLTESDLLKLASNPNKSVLKASTRDMAHACATGAMAATTVASTMKIAHLAGISVFATGGIGGVHRGVESTMDISADLLELSRTPVTVVCAGIKSILDISKSLEVLETNSVPVLSYGTSIFPAFYTNDSGIPSPRSVDYTKDIATLMSHQRLLRLDSGVLVAVPNPSPASGDKIQYAINFALNSAKQEGITGAKVTPYVLERVQQLTQGESLESNIALVLNNARVAAEIAVDYASLLDTDVRVREHHERAFYRSDMDSRRKTEDCVYISTATGSSNTSTIKSIPTAVVSEVKAASAGSASSSTDAQTAPITASPATTTATTVPAITTAATAATTSSSDILVIGGAVVDFIGHISTMTKYNTSNPGALSISHGGVGRNIAESIARLGSNVSLATAVADDINGRSIIEHGRKMGINMTLTNILQSNSTMINQEKQSEKKELETATTQYCTAIYNAIHDNSGDLCIGIADMSIFSQITPDYIQSLTEHISKASIIVIDGNLTKEAFSTIAHISSAQKVPIFFEPTSDHKCLLPFQAGCFQQVDIIKPNLTELVHMMNHCLSAGLINSGRALVQNTLSMIAADRISPGSMSSLDVSDIRILCNALYQVMTSSHSGSNNASRGSGSSNGKSGFLGNFLKSDSIKSDATAAPINAIPPTSTTAHSSSMKHVVTGKHIIVSLGHRGILWCGPAKQLAPSVGNNSHSQDPNCVVNEATQSATILIPALNIKPQDIVHTNGAGDAFCAGLLAEVVQKHHASKELDVQQEGVNTTLLPDMECIQKGLFSAHHWLVTK